MRFSRCCANMGFHLKMLYGIRWPRFYIYIYKYIYIYVYIYICIYIYKALYRDVAQIVFYDADVGYIPGCACHADKPMQCRWLSFLRYQGGGDVR